MTDNVKLYNHALPTSEGQNALIVRDIHTQSENIIQLHKDLDQLATNNNLGAIADEAPLIKTVGAWAYADKQITRDQFLDIYAGTVFPEFSEGARARAGFLADAIDKGVPVIFYDKRITEMSSSDQNNEGFVASVSETYETLNQIRKDNPIYGQKIKSLEDMAQQLHDAGVPSDVISAQIITVMAPHGKNIIVLPGAAHVSGAVLNKGAEAQGILDEALEQAGWSVTDGYIGDFSKIRSNMISHRHDCGISDKGTDFILDTSSPETELLAGSHSDLSAKGVAQLGPDFYSCTTETDPSLPAPSEKYKPDQIDPRRNPNLDSVISHTINAYRR